MLAYSLRWQNFKNFERWSNLSKFVIDILLENFSFLKSMAQEIIGQREILSM